MARCPNVIAAQSGGPSAVVNCSLLGILDGCRETPSTFGKVYGAWRGVEGVLREELLELTGQPAEELALLRTTPAAGAIGTSRYALAASEQEDWERLFQVARAHGVGYFFYIGGNGSMATANLLDRHARERGLDMVVIGVPKTIDNDLGDPEFRLLDHSPGYGSVARYWALNIQAAEEENRGSMSSDPVLVIQTMGRDVGFIAAAARLADPERRTPMLVCLPEAGLTLSELTELTAGLLRREGRAVLVVSEGLDFVGVGAVRDSKGQVQYSSSGQSVAQLLVNHFNSSGLGGGARARANVPGTGQRHSVVLASTVDMHEAYRVGIEAVRIAASGAGGQMASIHREPGASYWVRYDGVDLAEAASARRRFPGAWIAPNHVDVTDEFVRYAQPLLGDDWPRVPLVSGRQRFARLMPHFAEKRLAPYVPQAYR